VTAITRRSPQEPSIDPHPPRIKARSEGAVERTKAGAASAGSLGAPSGGLNALADKAIESGPIAIKVATMSGETSRLRGPRRSFE